MRGKHAARSVTGSITDAFKESRFVRFIRPKPPPPPSSAPTAPATRNFEQNETRSTESRRPAAQPFTESDTTLPAVGPQPIALSRNASSPTLHRATSGEATVASTHVKPPQEPRRLRHSASMEGPARAPSSQNRRKRNSTAFEGLGEVGGLDGGRGRDNQKTLMQDDRTQDTWTSNQVALQITTSSETPSSSTQAQAPTPKRLRTLAKHPSINDHQLDGLDTKSCSYPPVCSSGESSEPRCSLHGSTGENESSTSTGLLESQSREHRLTPVVGCQQQEPGILVSVPAIHDGARESLDTGTSSSPTWENHAPDHLFPSTSVSQSTHHAPIFPALPSSPQPGAEWPLAQQSTRPWSRTFSSDDVAVPHEMLQSQSKASLLNSDCHTCGKSFETCKAMEGHAKETGCRSFKCKKCDYTTNRHDLYIRHMTSHSGKRYLCHHCSHSPSFARPDNLQKHISTRHRDGYAPVHACPYTWCKYSKPSMAFSTLNDRERHMMQNHGHGKLDCPEPRCKRTGPHGYTREADLLKHLETKHPAQAEKHFLEMRLLTALKDDGETFPRSSYVSTSVPPIQEAPGDFF